MTSFKSILRCTIAAIILSVVPSVARAEWYAKGKRDYDRYCIWCHGEYGNGNGPSASRFDPAPRDFTAAQFKCRSTPSGSLPTDADLERAIRQGLHGAAMPAWAVLGPIQLEDLLPWIKHFSSRWSGEKVPAPIAVPPEPVSPGSVAHGATVFAKMQCAQCHGDGGGGNGPAAVTLRDDRGNTIRVPDLTKKGAFKCGDDAARIYLTFMTGLDGTPMPSFAASLSPSDAWDLAHFVVSLRR